MTSQSKTHLFGAAEPGSQFIQLQVRELEMAEAALVQSLRVLARTGQKGWEWWPVESPATRSAAEGSSPSASARSALWRSGAKGFSNGTRACGVEHGTWCGKQDLERSPMRSAWPCLPSPTSAWM